MAVGWEIVASTGWLSVIPLVKVVPLNAVVSPRGFTIVRWVWPGRADSDIHQTSIQDQRHLSDAPTGRCPGALRFHPCKGSWLAISEIVQRIMKIWVTGFDCLPGTVRGLGPVAPRECNRALHVNRLPVREFIDHEFTEEILIVPFLEAG
jgi:hypothetical protein